MNSSLSWLISGVVALAALLPGPPALAAEPTLAAVKKRGELVCGVNGNLPAFSYLNDKKERLGFDADYCRAIAAAVLGDASKVKFVPLPIARRFEALTSGEIDVLLRHSIVTLERTADTGVRYAAINFIDGQAFVAPKALGLATLQQFEGKLLCLTQNTPHKDNVETWFRLRGLAIKVEAFDDQDAMYQAFFAGKCALVTQEATVLASTVIASGKAANYLMLPEFISREPLGPYVRSGDDQWFNVVHWLHNAMVQAEELGVTQGNVDQQVTSKDPNVLRLLGVEPGTGRMLGLDEKWAYNAIRQVGNYADVYERNFGAGSPLKFARGVNALLGRGGFLFALPVR
jgi:general L-amino acid transport system substrate-binding protein